MKAPGQPNVAGAASPLDGAFSARSGPKEAALFGELITLVDRYETARRRAIDATRELDSLTQTLKSACAQYGILHGWHRDYTVVRSGGEGAPLTPVGEASYRDKLTAASPPPGAPVTDAEPVKGYPTDAQMREDKQRGIAEGLADLDKAVRASAQYRAWRAARAEGEGNGVMKGRRVLVTEHGEVTPDDHPVSLSRWIVSEHYTSARVVDNPLFPERARYYVTEAEEVSLPTVVGTSRSILDHTVLCTLIVYLRGGNPHVVVGASSRFDHDVSAQCRRARADALDRLRALLDNQN